MQFDALFDETKPADKPAEELAPAPDRKGSLGRKDRAAQVVGKLLEIMERGEIPWRRPWSAVGVPANLVSKAPYRGFNNFLLSLMPYRSQWWLTYRQAKELGGYVREGEKGTTIIFWKLLELERETEDGDKIGKRIPLLRTYTVFNAEQCEGIEHRIPPLPPAPDPVESCERIVCEYVDRPTIEYSGGQTFYRPTTDHVQMPPREAFQTPGALYSILFHELIHSTGHVSRTGRLAKPGSEDMGACFGSEPYAREELVAEIGACLLRSLARIDDDRELTQSAAYVQSWRRRLTAEPSLLIRAAQDAQKAVDWMRRSAEKKNVEENAA